MEAYALRCEYLENPLGIDALRPRLSWKLRSGRQTSYQIVAESDGHEIWDSGRVDSSRSINVRYDGPLLRSGQRITWRVRIWNGKAEPGPYSPPAGWEMGLLDCREWQGRWIGSSIVGGPATSPPCPHFRKSFPVDQPMAAARLYITALGLFEASLNGVPVSDDVFAPGWTEYRSRVLYLVYDIAPLLRDGLNTIGVILGDGWYCGHVAWAPRQIYGDRPRLLAQIVLRYVDGSERITATDPTWKTTAGPILESDLIMGERYDARQEIPGWDRPDFDDSGWNSAVEFPDPGISLVARRSAPVRRTQRLRPLEPPRRRDGKWIFDLGQNIAGRVRLWVEGTAGLAVRLRHAEVLSPDGSLYTENLRAARASDEYILKGGAKEVYEPHFTFHGFRYVEVEGLPDSTPPPEIEGIVIHSDLPRTGTFECSNPLINRLQQNIQWSQRGNFLDIPTDCPQRNERLGWTGDAQVFIRTAAFNMDVAAFFTKWLEDMAAAQSRQGHIPHVVPNPDPSYYDGGPAWADAVMICPWTIYTHYADTELLDRLYPVLTKFVDELDRRHPDGIRERPDLSAWSRSDQPRIEAVLGFGDWLAPDGSVDRHGNTPRDLIGTAFFFDSARRMASIAAVLEKPQDEAKYARLAEKIRRAFVRRFFTPDGLLAGQTQTSYVLALHFDLTPEAARPALVEALVRDIERRRGHLATGFVGTPYLLHVLTRFDRPDVAFQLLNQTTWPSWLYSVVHGATTIWERWDGWTADKGFQTPAMNSFNHYAFGAVGDWLYAVVAGIEVDPRLPGFKHILFRPRPGGGLTWARAELESPYGRIVSSWQVSGNLFEWEIMVPPNTTGSVFLPGASSATEMPPGTHRLRTNWPGRASDSGLEGGVVPVSRRAGKEKTDD